MRLKLRLVRPTGIARDVVVTADAVATVGEVAKALIERDPSKSLQSVPSPTLSVIFPGSTSRTVLVPTTPVSEARIASGADVSVVSADQSTGDVVGAVLAILRVESGPSLGREFQLRSGSYFIGRDETSDFVIDDPQVSKRHARVEVSKTIDFVDLNSANGLVVDGGEVARVSIESGQTVMLGGSVLRAQVMDQAPRSSATEIDGPVAFNRSPRVEARYPGEERSGPDVPREVEPTPFPWIAFIAPLVLGVVMFFVMNRNPASIAFIALSPILMAGTYITQKLKNKKQLSDQIAQFGSRIDRLAETMDREIFVERHVRLEEAASTEQMLSHAYHLGQMLWTRRPEHWNFLNVRLGLGEAPSRNTITGKDDPSGIPAYADKLTALVEKYENIAGVPIVDNLVGAGALGIAGSVTASTASVNSVLVQLASLHSPLELSFTAIVGPTWATQFEWLKWLPHTGAPNAPVQGTQLASAAATGNSVLAGLEELIQQRTAKNSNKRIDQTRGPIGVKDSVMIKSAVVGDKTKTDEAIVQATPCVVVLISDDAPVSRARLVTMVERAAEAGILPIWVAESPAALPAACRTFVELDETGQNAAVGFVRTGERLEHVAIESIAGDAALAFARRLAAVTDAGALVADESDIPRSVSFVDLIGADLSTSSEAVIDRWTQNVSMHDRTAVAPFTPRKAGRLRALVGQSAQGSFHLDLRVQGPHALVGGTTGAGKSEFLQAWVLGMAAEYSPDRVSFLFVDYKGGSAFADCVNLPHTVGLVTDLSPHLVRRALTSLRAELHFREHLLNRKKAKDLIELEKRGDPDSPPALVLVIDEFAALVSEIPEFVDGVVDIAQRGRSLGIHLIMATQRPAGVIKDNLRANTNLRIALRMADESDSQDVVGDRVAASFDPAIPGRGIAKTGPGALTSFQSAYAGGWTTSGPVAAVVEVADLRFGAEYPWEKAEEATPELPVDQGPTDQTRVVTTLVAAAAAAGIPAPRRPWLDELAPVFDLTKLRQRTDSELAMAVADIPDEQRQDVTYFRPDTDGNLAVYGTGGSGKTVMLRTLAAAAGITPRGGPVDVYGLDFAGNGLKMLEALPHVGSVVSGDDPDRVIRLLRMLRDELAVRGEKFAAMNAGSIVDYRKQANEPQATRILLLVDGFPAFRADFEASSATAPWYGVFSSLVGEGRQLGIHVAITADRPSSVPTAISSAIQRRIVLRLADEQGYSLLDVPKDILSAESAPGRAIIDGLEAQVAIVGTSPAVAEQSAAMVRLGIAIEQSGRAKATPIGTLAKEIAPDSLPAAVGGRPVLGISDDNLEPIAFDPTGVFVLGGPPASGRTTALRWMAASVQRALPAVEAHYFGNARSVIGNQPGWASVSRTVEEAAESARALSAKIAEAPDSPKIFIVIEGIADFLSSSADSALVDLIKAVKRSNHFLIAESETSSWGSSWPLLAEVKGARTGFLLQPETMEGDMILRTAFPRASRADFPAGRGMYVARGKAVRVQAPLLEE